MKKCLFLFLTAFVFLSASEICSQEFPDEYVSSVWTSAEGLPANTITDIIQSSDGYIYLGTYEGLVKTDGVKFEIINRSSHKDFNCSSARRIFEDSKKNLWIGSNDDGIAKFDGKNYTLYTIESGLPSNSIRTICEDNNGNIWIGTASGVCFISLEGNVETPAINSPDGNKVTCYKIYCDTAGRMWLITTEKDGIYIYSKGSFSRWTALLQYGSFYYTTITQDASGAFWIGFNNNGAVKINDGRIQFVNKNEIEGLSVHDIFCDSTRALWFATDKGILQLRNDVFSKYDESNGLTNNSVAKIMEDREGNIWFATDLGGVERMRLSKFRTEKLSSPVNAIAEDKEGRVWIGSDTGLLCKKNNGDFITNPLTDFCKGIRIRHIAITKDGGILVSCYSKIGQVLMTSDGTIKSWTTKNGLAGEKTRVALEGSDGNIYVGTTTGLSIISPDGKIENIKITDGLNNEYIMALFEDENKSIWVGTDGGGISILKDKKIIRNYTAKEGLSGNVIFKITENEGYIWICTGSGITSYDGKTFTSFGSASGLGSSSVFQMIPDYTDVVWMTSNRGISSVPMGELKNYINGKTNKIFPKFYTKGDGLKIGGVTSTSLSLCDSLGRIWFTLNDGYTIYDPVKSKAINVAPLVKIADLTADNTNISIKPNIIINPGTKRILIDYTGFSFASPETIRFRYKLVGFDSEFSPITASRAVSYTNLKPGAYKFILQASSGDGVWSETDDSISIYLKPFIYERPVFWIILILLIVLLVFLGVRLKIRQMVKIQKQLEQKVEERTYDLEVEKNKSENLLLNILPSPIAQRLKANDKEIIADQFQNATVLFSDIQGFTTIASSHTASEIVGALNTLFSKFDERAEKEGVEKIKTIGDAYMAATGLPAEQDDHVLRMLKYASGIISDLEEYNKTAEIKFKMRVGINSGTVIAGIIGKNKFIYDIWGDTVNVASRMESAGNPEEITVSQTVKDAAEAYGIKFENPRQCEIKGKGLMTVYSAIL